MAFPQQQRLGKFASLLHYTFIGCRQTQTRNGSPQCEVVTNVVDSVAVNLWILVQALCSNNVLRISVCVCVCVRACVCEIAFQTLQNDPTRINAYTA
jgi:hypothetical protein